MIAIRCEQLGALATILLGDLLTVKGVKANTPGEAS